MSKGMNADHSALIQIIRGLIRDQLLVNVALISIVLKFDGIKIILNSQLTNMRINYFCVILYNILFM